MSDLEKGLMARIAELEKRLGQKATVSKIHKRGKPLKRKRQRTPAKIKADHERMARVRSGKKATA